MTKTKIDSIQKIKLAFEYGVVLGEVANDLKKKLNTESIEEAEKMIINEFSSKEISILASEMIPNLLSILNPK